MESTAKGWIPMWILLGYLDTLVKVKLVVVSIWYRIVNSEYLAMLRIRTILEKWVRIRSDFRLNKTNVYSVQLGKEFCFDSTMCVFNNWSLPPSYSMEWPFLASKEPKIQRKWPKFDTRFCFGHNIWSDAYFSIPFSLVMYIYPARCIENPHGPYSRPYQVRLSWPNC